MSKVQENLMLKISSKKVQFDLSISPATNIYCS